MEDRVRRGFFIPALGVSGPSEKHLLSAVHSTFFL